MNTSATLAHLKNKLFDAFWHETTYQVNPLHKPMWRERRKRLSRAVRYLEARREKQLAAKGDRRP